MTTIEALVDDCSLYESIYQFEDINVDLFANMARSRYNASLMEGDRSIIMEGLGDVCATIGNAIKKLIIAIKDFFMKFVKMITSFHLNLKDFVKKYKDELLKVDCDFDIIGYNFKVMESKDPNMDDFRELVDGYNASLSDIESIKKADITKEGNAFLEDKHLDEIRGRVLGVGGIIQKDDFTETVRKYYRGANETESIHVDGAVVREIVNNVDKLWDMKNKSIKDRDRILLLLNKAETFFHRKVGTAYRGSQKKVDARTFELNDDVRTAKTKETDIDDSNSTLEKVNLLVVTKYNETKAVSSIINVVITERANALKDMVKQNRKIVGKALSSGKNGSDETSTEEATDYSNIIEQFEYVYHDAAMVESKNILKSELNFLMESLDSGVIETEMLEADLKKAATTAGKAVKEAIGAVIDNIMRMYREKAIRNIQEKKDWYTNQEVIDGVIANAEAKSFNMVPLWDGVYGQQALSSIQTLFKAASEKPTDPASANFAKDFTGVKTISELKADKDMTAKLKNYFRTGKKDVVTVEPVSIGKKQLQNKVKDMFDYLADYDNISKGSETLGKAAKNIKQPVGESVSMDTFINLLCAPICESDLILLEATPTAGQQTSATGAPAKAASDVRSAPSNQAAQQNGREQVSVTQAEDTSNNTTGNQATDPNAKKDTTLADYHRVVGRFCRQVASAYVTTLEERFLLYYNTLVSCAGEEFAPSKYLKGEENNAPKKEENVAQPTENK